MANKNLGEVQTVESILRSNCIFVEVGSSVRRITLDNLMNSINQGNEELLRQVGWCVPIKQEIQTSPDWGTGGNRQMWEAYKSQCGRYLVKNNGHAAKLSVANSGVFADGTPLDESIGHVLFRSPRLYYLLKNDEVSGIPYLWMSQLPIGGKFIPQQLAGAYLGAISNSALVSRSGLVPTANKSIQEFFNAAQANGKDWGLTDYNFRRLLMMLALSEYGNTNIQTSLGYGVGGAAGCSWDDFVAYASKLTTGATKSNGDACAANPVTYTGSKDESCHISLFGVEDPCNWFFEMTQGIYCGSSANTGQDGHEVFIYEGNRMPTDTELSSHPEGDFRQLEKIWSEGYVSKMLIGEYFDLVALAHGGGSNSNWSDYHNGGSGTGQLVLWGGDASYGSSAGLAFAYSADGWAYAYSDIGARLAYYGDLKIMSGRQLVAE